MRRAIGGQGRLRADRFLPPAEIVAADKALFGLPKDEAAARRAWTAERAVAEVKSRPLNGTTPHAQAFAGDPHGSSVERAEFDSLRRNFPS